MVRGRGPPAITHNNKRRKNQSTLFLSFINFIDWKEERVELINDWGREKKNESKTFNQFHWLLPSFVFIQSKDFWIEWKTPGGEEKQFNSSSLIPSNAGWWKRRELTFLPSLMRMSKESNSIQQTNKSLLNWSCLCLGCFLHAEQMIELIDCSSLASSIKKFHFFNCGVFGYGLAAQEKTNNSISLLLLHCELIKEK